MQNAGPTNLCETCREVPLCIKQGVFEQQTCDYYESLSLNELAERDKFVRVQIVGACPKCSSKKTSDCDSPLELIRDSTIGYCLDCGTYWCIECGYVFAKMGEGVECSHWGICAECSDENGYLNVGEFIEKICPTCQHYDDGCRLEDPSECEKQLPYQCSHEHDVSECTKVKEFLSEQT